MKRRYSKSLKGEVHTELRKFKKGLINTLVLFAVIALIIGLNNFLDIDGIPKIKDIAENVTVARNSGVSVHFIDVGQGDCELIVTPKYNVLIDCGESDKADTVAAYLSNQNIGKLDYVLATHPHSDHIGSMGYIVNTFHADNVIMPDIQDSIVPTTRAYTKLLDAAEEQNSNVIFAKFGMTIDLSGGILLTLLSPVRDYDDLNNYSVTAKLTYGKTSFLFTGDIEKEAEQDILDSNRDISAGVLKVAHHGSNTSSTEEFLRKVGGMYAVIGVGMPNSYGHPKQDTLDKLTKLGYTVFTTAEYGNIVFASDGNDYKIYTA